MKEPQMLASPDIDKLRAAVQAEYAVVAREPQRGFHFHTGRRLAKILEYESSWLEGIPEQSVESFAGTGNPFRAGTLFVGERVIDVGCGAGLDSLIGAKMVGAAGQVIGVDMTHAMLERARAAASLGNFANVEFREGYGEALPAPSGWADVVISNGALNLMPDKVAALGEMSRVLKTGGRLQIADILVQRAVSDEAKRDIDLWTG